MVNLLYALQELSQYVETRSIAAQSRQSLFEPFRFWQSSLFSRTNPFKVRR